MRVHNMLMKILRHFRGALGFLTILPVGMEKLNVVAEGVYMFPLVGAMMGAIASLVALPIRDPYLRGFILVALLEILSGFLHFDGLVDLADAMMAIAPPEKRLEILKDKHKGAGAIGAGVLSLILAGLGFSQLIQDYLVQVTAIVEAWSKVSMIIVASLGKPSSLGGLGAYFVNSLHQSKYRLIYTILVSILISMIMTLSLKFTVIVMILTLSVAALMTRLSLSTLGCITGDVLGATNELCRIMLLIVIGSLL